MFPSRCGMLRGYTQNISEVREDEIHKRLKWARGKNRRKQNRGDKKAAIETMKYEQALDDIPTLSGCQWDLIDIQGRTPLLAAHIRRRYYDQ